MLDVCVSVLAVISPKAKVTSLEIVPVAVAFSFRLELNADSETSDEETRLTKSTDLFFSNTACSRSEKMVVCSFSLNLVDANNGTAIKAKYINIVTMLFSPNISVL
ncbi:hypothetical protein D3C84_899580 [compost metagenome]